MNCRPSVWTLVMASVAFVVVPGCAVDTGDGPEGGADEETAATEDELASNAARLVGAYHNGVSSAGRPAFAGIVFQTSSDFSADVDAGIRCVQAPCPSDVRLTGRFRATRSYLRLLPKAGERAHSFHGRYRYTLVNDKLSLTRTGENWQNWSNQLEREPVETAPDFCRDGVVKSEPGYSASSDGNECSTPHLHCLTTNPSACPVFSSLPPDYCRDGTVEREPGYTASSDSKECSVPRVHCVTLDPSACPMRSSLPPDYCRDGSVKMESGYIASRDGMECSVPSAHCVTNAPSACPVF